MRMFKYMMDASIMYVHVILIALSVQKGLWSTCQYFVEVDTPTSTVTCCN